MSDGPFSIANQRRAVERVLADIPAGAKRIAIVYGRTDGVVQITYVERLGPHWTLGALLGHAPEEGWTGEVALKGVW